MSDFELDVTQRSVGSFALTTPEGRIEYDILPLTREPMLLFDKMRSHDVSGGTIDENASAIIEVIASLLAPHNGGPPAGEVLNRMWAEGFLSMSHIQEMQKFFVEKAVGDGPPA